MLMIKASKAARVGAGCCISAGAGGSDDIVAVGSDDVGLTMMIKQ